MWIADSFANKHEKLFYNDLCRCYWFEAEIINLIFIELDSVSNTTISITTTIILLNIHMIIAFDMFISLQGKLLVYSIEYRGELE